jgi:hypothetical protein
MRLYNFPILLSFLFTEKYLLFLQKSCAFSGPKTDQRRYFSEEFRCFSWNRNRLAISGLRGVLTTTVILIAQNL